MKPFISLVLVLSLAACGGPLSLLTGGGPNVAANTQGGKTNNQTIGETNITEQKVVRPQARQIEQSTGETKVRSERVETVVVHEKDSTWLILSLVLASALFAAALVWGWLTPSPKERKLKRKLHDMQVKYGDFGS